MLRQMDTHTLEWGDNLNYPTTVVLPVTRFPVKRIEQKVMKLEAPRGHLVAIRRADGSLEQTHDRIVALKQGEDIRLFPQTKGG
ncbi:MAG: hypothetical protein AB1571_02610 [Nanoarchaeota archaeon]